jgi:hypothetical protein
VKNRIEHLKSNIFNIIGTQSNQKLVIFDSDDWGSIRVPDAKVRNKLMAEGINMNDNSYNKYDCLESETDLTALYDVLRAHKDSFGHHPIIEMNMVMANPDFEKIKENNYNNYFYENIGTTYERYWHKDQLPLLKQGMNERLVLTQFHAREHLNVSLWLKALKHKDKQALTAFQNGFFGHSGITPSVHHHHYLAAFHHQDNHDLEEKKQILSHGLDLFEETFGFRSRSFIACNYIWHSELESVALEHSAVVIKSQRAQLQPGRNTGKLQAKYHYTGQQNKNYQKYLVRNVIFEPSEDPGIDWVTKCMKEMEIAFFWKKPVVISTHRVNYIGSINEKNRSHNLALLSELLAKMLKRWPDIEFCTSDQIF